MIQTTCQSSKTKGWFIICFTYFQISKELDDQWLDFYLAFFICSKEIKKGLQHANLFRLFQMIFTS